MPTADEVNEAIDRFDRDCQPGEWLLRQLFHKYPRNTNLDHVFLKTIVLNKVYNAGVRAENPVAKHIESLPGLDSLIEEGSDDAVNRIAHVKIAGREFCFLAFASKYCSWHNLAAYPIFDKNVRECLLFHKRKDGFAKFTLDSLYDYPSFRDVVNKFRRRYGLQFSYKDLDKFMWLCGGRLLDAKAAAKSSNRQATAGPPEEFRQP
jgi:hypothetical protein